jgi:hypothetical protein
MTNRTLLATAMVIGACLHPASGASQANPSSLVHAKSVTNQLVFVMGEKRPDGSFAMSKAYVHEEDEVQSLSGGVITISRLSKFINPDGTLNSVRRESYGVKLGGVSIMKMVTPFPPNLQFSCQPNTSCITVNTLEFQSTNRTDTPMAGSLSTATFATDEALRDRLFDALCPFAVSCNVSKMAPTPK